jgi:hypothetical protein
MKQCSRPRATWLATSCVFVPTLLAAILGACGGTTSTGGPEEDAAPEATVEVDASGATQDATTREAESEDAAPEATPEIDASNAAQDASTGSDAGDAAQEATTALTDGGVHADATLPDGSPDATTPDGSVADARPGDANADTGSDSESPTVDAAPDVAPPSCSPGCPDGNQCVVDDDCASSACNSGICASSIPCGNPCPANTTCIGEAAPVAGEGQTCSMSCAGGSQIATITDVYATNCNPTSCSAAIASCPNNTSCDVTLSNDICGVDPCPGTAKSWSVTITCN